MRPTLAHGLSFDVPFGLPFSLFNIRKSDSNFRIWRFRPRRLCSLFLRKGSKALPWT
jgi:hypothetical protein